MLKQRRCEEIVSGNGKIYRFAGTFGAIESVSFLSGDPAELFTKLAEDKLPPTDIRNVVLCTMMEVDGKPVDDLKRNDLVTEFVEDFGLQDCSLLARHLISHALIGDIKKKADRSEGEGKGAGLEVEAFDFDAFRSSWLVMGGSLGSFASASMYDFQTLLKAYKLQHGIKEDEIVDVDELDDLYSGLAETIKQNPENWR